jgi:hypothetical protein
MNKSRIHIIGIPTYLVINMYIKEIKQKNRSYRNIKTEINVPVEYKELPSRLGNKINILI